MPSEVMGTLSWTSGAGKVAEKTHTQTHPQPGHRPCFVKTAGAYSNK